jgi:ribosomal protein L29
MRQIGYGPVMDDQPKPRDDLPPEERARLLAELERELAEAEAEIETGDHVDAASFFARMKKRIAEWARSEAHPTASKRAE